jgi:thiosulfate dehydrogenase (quinone) large subunit
VKNQSYVLARLAIGISLFGHGLVRLPKLAGFSAWMVSLFEKSLLPSVLVVPFSYALPVLEFGIGLLLIFGLFTKQVLYAGSAVMLSLMFGTTMIENWDALPSQLIHLAFLSVLLHFADSNALALDKLRK